MKNFIILLIVLAIIGGGVYLWTQRSIDNGDTTIDESTTTDETQIDEETPAGSEEPGDGDISRIGTSAGGRAINVHHYGSGDTEVMFVGGIHGGYSWNTSLVAYELMDYLEANPNAVPDNVEVSVIPVLNPDGLNEVVGTAGRFTASDVPASEEETIPGRFNANNVDLNRNFDCDWQSTGVWQDTEVDGGDQVFSEPESQAIRDYVNAENPDAVVVWYSAAGGVFASNCHNGPLAETLTLVNTYADASGYPAYEEFDFYEITGDMTNWLAGEGIPAISVLLTNHQDIEWDENRVGIEALLNYYAE